MDSLLLIIGILWTATSLIAATIILIQGTQPRLRPGRRARGAPWDTGSSRIEDARPASTGDASSVSTRSSGEHSTVPAPSVHRHCAGSPRARRPPMLHHP